MKAIISALSKQHDGYKLYIDILILYLRLCVQVCIWEVDI